MMTIFMNFATAESEIINYRKNHSIENQSISHINSDILNIKELINATIQTHPQLRAMQLQKIASEQDIKAIERLSWPTLSIVAETDTNKSGVNVVSPTRLLRAEQILWDGGNVSSKVGEAKTSLEITLIQADIQRQELLLQLINNWQNLYSATEKKRIAAKTLERLKGFQNQMQRRIAAQASPQIDLELINSRVLQTEVELNSANTQLQIAIMRLEKLSNLSNVDQRVKLGIEKPTLQEIRRFSKSIENSDFSTIAKEHSTVRKSKFERNLLENKLATKKSEIMPQIYVRIDAPFGNASTNQGPTLLTGVRFTPGTGFMSQAESKAISTRLQSQEYSIEVAQRDIYQTILIDKEELTSVNVRIDALEKSVMGAEVVLDSYTRQFQAGRKSWQDLLNAARDLAQNEYSMADYLAASTGAMYRLQLRMGFLN